MMKQKFPNVSVLAKSNKVYKIPGSRQGDYDLVTDIQQTRMDLYNTIVHETNCQWFLECLENYKYEFNSKLQIWTNKPLHDKHSNMMDALRYADQANRELNFFGGKFFEQPGQASSMDYIENWEGVWAR
jgi:hypothetical protein